MPRDHVVIRPGDKAARLEIEREIFGLDRQTAHGWLDETASNDESRSESGFRE